MDIGAIFAFQNHLSLKLQLGSPQVFSYILIVFFISALIFPFKKNNTTEFLNKSSTDVLRGVSIFVIIIGHINYYILEGHPLIFWGWLGSFGVSIFLFLSGYGLSESYKKKGLDAFFENKFIRVYIPFFGCNIFFIIIDLFLHTRNYTILSFFQHIIGYRTSIDAYWYLHYLFYWYFLFFIVSFVFKKSPFWCALLFIGSLIPFFFNTFGVLEKETSLCFPLGVLISQKKELLNDKKFNFKEWIIIALFFMLVAGYFLFPFPAQSVSSIRDIAGCIHKTLWAIIILIILYQFVNTRKPLIFSFLGGISYELYLIHMPFIVPYDFILYRFKFYYSLPLYILFITVVSYMFNRIFRKIKKVFFVFENAVLA